MAMERKLGPGLPQLRKNGNLTQLVAEGEPFVMLAGEVHNSSASSLEYMEQSWGIMAQVHCNTAIVPLYWELVEPEEGHFDFTLADGLLEGARRRGMRLVFLWFGTWKNADGSYVPAWVKTDPKRFPRAQAVPGQDTTALSALGEETCRADCRAFAAVMEHLREVDGEAHTVLMMQVQNEAGILGSSRDRSPLAEAAFAGPVSQELMVHLRENRETLLPEVRALWEAGGFRETGTWSQVFGEGADEVFMAWHVARYIERVTAAGKAEYPLPMYANAWLVQYPTQRPGAYPSGGPVSRMLDIWRAAAPSIDVLAPDIYLPTFKEVCASYTRSGNPLLIPEASVRVAPATVFYALGQHDALCFAPFGIDGSYDPQPLAAAYEFLTHMMPLLLRHQGTGRMAGILQEGEQTQDVALGRYRLQVRFNRATPTGGLPGYGLVIAVGPEEYVVVGAGFSVRFLAEPGSTAQVGFLSVDEGRFREGQWVPGRRLNGDEQGVRLGDALSARWVKVYRF